MCVCVCVYVCMCAHTHTHTQTQGRRVTSTAAAAALAFSPSLASDDNFSLVAGSVFVSMYDCDIDCEIVFSYDDNTDCSVYA